MNVENAKVKLKLVSAKIAKKRTSAVMLASMIADGSGSEGRMAAKEKPAPYANTSVHYAKTQGEIIELFDKYGILDIRFTSLGSSGQLIFEFTNMVEMQKQMVPASVRIVIPNITEKNRNQLHRALFYYLKSKMEALSFEFVEFVKEFFPYLVTRDDAGRTTTIYDYLGPQYKLALAGGQNHVLNLLPEGMKDAKVQR
ncbi:hypothetical protein [Desulfosporosinus sp. OT]|uniref:hypothetical protein n=1 Tax=Desulfosporosinus sp. OT TaxID=913865 RepID=UPI000590262E|nr:hypothetical protein [Desulfosporosinus sp. OT]